MSEAADERDPRAQHADDYEVVVIGAGQAGLAIGHYLARQGRRFSILERGDSIGARMARALGLANPLHPSPLQRPCPACLSRATRTAIHHGTR